MHSPTVRPEYVQHLEVYNWKWWLWLFIGNIVILSLGILLLGSALIISTKTIGLQPPIVVGYFDWRFVIVLLCAITGFPGFIVGLAQSLLVFKRFVWRWATISGLGWILSVFIIGLVFVVSEIFLHDETIVAPLWLQLAIAVSVGTLVGFGQAHYLPLLRQHGRWWIIINSIDYVLVWGLASGLRMVR